MDELVKKHPLYPQLAHVDAGIAALQMRTDIAGPNLSPEEIAAQEKILQKQLDDAANRTQTMIKAKQADYAKREDEAMRRLIAQAGAGGPAPGAIGAAMSQTQAQQAAAAASAQGAGLENVRQETLRSAQAQLDAARKTLSDRAQSLYRARVETLQQKESTYSLGQSAAHSAERLTLRTKLSNLALDDSERAAARARLDELDREEADGLAAMRNRDQAELAAYHDQIEKQLAADLKIKHDQVQKQAVAQLGAVQTAAVAPAGADGATRVVVRSAGGSAELQAQLKALHEKYQADFDRDTRQVVADFAKTRDDLSRRFARLHGADAAAGTSAQKELDALQRQRSDLYGQIVAEIDSEVRLIAQRRGVSVVVGNILAPAGGVDLTPDAEKVVETLHE
jgi:hypothetical protein